MASSAETCGGSSRRVSTVASLAASAVVGVGGTRATTRGPITLGSLSRVLAWLAAACASAGVAASSAVRFFRRMEGVLLNDSAPANQRKW